NDMLVLARADNDYPLRRSLADVGEIVADCARTATVLARDRGVTLRRPPPAEFPLECDDDLIRRMLLNLVQNAIQHTPSGKQVRVDVTSGHAQMTIDVTNDGAPIPDADRERIFDRFVQLDPARRTTGSGLGLPIARWIAEAHGGTLVVHSSNDRETTF